MIAREIIKAAILLVVNLSVKNPQTGTDTPPSKFPTVSAIAALC